MNLNDLNGLTALFFLNQLSCQNLQVVSRDTQRISITQSLFSIFSSLYSLLYILFSIFSFLTNLIVHIPKAKAITPRVPIKNQLA